MIEKIFNFVMSLLKKNDFVFDKKNDSEDMSGLSLYNHIRNLYLSHGVPWDEINIFGIRDESEQEEDLFNDYIGIATKGIVYLFRATCDPGSYWTKVGGYNRDNKGVAHICYGYHPNVYQVGRHKKYRAMIQTGAPIKIWRDKNNNFRKDDSEVVQTGYFGVNIHRASVALEVTKIGKWSAGCQVIPNPQDFMNFMSVIFESDSYNNDQAYRFSYFLFNKSQFNNYILI